MEISSANTLIYSQSHTQRSAESREASPARSQTDQPTSSKNAAVPNSTLPAHEGQEVSDDQFIRVYTGNYRSGAIHDPEKSAPLDAILERLSENEQAALIDNNTMLLDEEFMQLAEELSDDELRQFVAISSALQTPPLTGGQQTDRAYSATKEVSNLIHNLSAMDAETRTRVLDKAEGYAENVIKRPPSKPVYEAQDIWNYMNAAGTATKLTNFTAAITQSDDVNAMLDQLETFDEAQQNQLLGVLRRDIELGSQLMDQLEERDKAAQDAVLDYMEELDYAHRDLIKYNTYGDPKASLGFDNSGHTVLNTMMEDTVALLANYQFSDEQLQQMGEQLQQMERGDQRAYLAMTTTGLETLLGDPAEAGKQIDLSEHEEIFETVDTLRNDAQMRELVFKSRMGEESIHDGERRYAIKSLGEANRDVEGMVRFLTTDAWLNDKVEDSSAKQGQTSHLSFKLLEMGADQRDQLVHDLNSLGQDDHALSGFTDSALQEIYGDFFDRTTTIANVTDLEALSEAEQKTSPALRESFWQATEIAGSKAGDLLELLDNSQPEIRNQVITTLAEQATMTEAGEKSRDDVQQELGSLINYFKEQHTETDKLSYLKQAF